MITVILDAEDADKLLRVLYNGRRPLRVHTLLCACGALADLRVSACAWTGWQVLPTAKCPVCIERTRAGICTEHGYPVRAQVRFVKLVEVATLEKES